MRYPLVEAGTALFFVAVVLFFGVSWVVIPFLYLAAISVALALIDLDTKRLPNVIVLPSYIVAAVSLTLATVFTVAWGDLLRAGAGLLILGGFYFLTNLIYPQGMGFGDVKLAGVLGLFLGYLGWGALIVGGFSAFLIGGLISVILMAAKKANRKTAIPFGPFMLLGAWLGVFAGNSLWSAYLSLFF